MTIAVHICPFLEECVGLGNEPARVRISKTEWSSALTARNSRPVVGTTKDQEKVEGNLFFKVLSCLAIFSVCDNIDNASRILQKIK